MSAHHPQLTQPQRQRQTTHSLKWTRKASRNNRWHVGTSWAHIFLTERDASLQDLRKSHSLDIDKGNLEDGDLRTRFPNVNEAAVIRRIDMRLIPILCAMFLLAFLDR